MILGCDLMMISLSSSSAFFDQQLRKWLSEGATPLVHRRCNTVLKGILRKRVTYQDIMAMKVCLERM